MDNVPNINLGRLIRIGLKRKKLSQADLARTMGVTSSLVSAWVNNKRIPTGIDLIRIVKSLDIVFDIFPEYQEQRKTICEKENIFKVPKEIDEILLLSRKLPSKAKNLQTFFDC